VYGPMQIEARVDQQTEISRELSLWGQKGSRVIRGNLLAIPIGNAFINVEPIYLEAKQEESDLQTTPAAQRGLSQQRGRNIQAAAPPNKSRSAALPELKRVIVAFSNSVIMGENLDAALSLALEKQMEYKGFDVRSVPQIRDISSLGALALEHFSKAKDYIRQGNWAEYGNELEKLERVLQEISDLPKDE